MSTASSHNGDAPAGPSIDEAAERVGVAPSTLRRWARKGLLPRYNGRWSPAVVSHAKIVARLRERGHSPEEIRKASDQGRLAYGYVEELFNTGEDVYTVAEAARETGLEPALIVRVVTAVGTAPAQVERLSADDVALLRYIAAVLDAGLPLVALLQLVRVYGQAMARDYYGRDVNIASRVGARAGGAEVLVPRPVGEHTRGEIEFERIADVRLKGFSESTEIFVARQRDEEE